MKTNSNSRTLAFNDWVRRLVRCYDEELSDAEREELHEWESHPDFPEIGLFVLTAKFLADRGACCERGCRHCPYIQ